MDRAQRSDEGVNGRYLWEMRLRDPDSILDIRIHREAPRPTSPLRK